MSYFKKLLLYITVEVTDFLIYLWFICISWFTNTYNILSKCNFPVRHDQGKFFLVLKKHLIIPTVCIFLFLINKKKSNYISICVHWKTHFHWENSETFPKYNILSWCFNVFSLLENALCNYVVYNILKFLFTDCAYWFMI